MILVAAAGAAAFGKRATALVLAVSAAAAMSGWLAADREAAARDAALPRGPVTVAAAVGTDPIEQWGAMVVAVRPTHLLETGGWRPWAGPRLRLEVDDESLGAGDRLLVVGSIVAAPGWLRGDPVAGRLVARRVDRLGGPGDPLFAAGNLIRARVERGIAPFRPRPAAALLSGFLIGDVRELPDAESDALRRTGLTHFVAVSGSNVALFLAAWWVAMGPLGWSPRLRAAIGLVGLALFVVVTRWEPSVVRAATMAAVVLGGRLAGVPIGGWTAFGSAVTLLLLTSGDLVFDVGFQLSAVATAGVLAGAGVWSHRRPRWAWTALGATSAAQVAVAPLLLIHFGSIPLLAPLANLVAAPLVAASTAAGGIGVLLGIEPITAVGVAAADVVLAVAAAGRDLPQMGWTGALAVCGGGVLAIRRGLRPLIALGAAVALGAWTIVPGLTPGGPEMIVLDVGQGDSILLRDPAGAVVLVDGGPDPAVLRRGLASRRIDRIDLLVMTHSHADHATGLVGITGNAAIVAAWISPGIGDDGVAGAVVEELRASGTKVGIPAPGWRAAVGSFSLRVLGPERRYESPNDGSLVVLVEAGGATALLAGDIEVIAQREIGTVHADILKVPHQGAATSAPEWLAAVGASVAVISVGPNDYGHPSEQVIAVLEGAGVTVLRTDRDGDVVVRFDRVASSRRRVTPQRYGGGDETRPRRSRTPRRRPRRAPRDAAQGPRPPRPGRRRWRRPDRRAAQGRR